MNLPLSPQVHRKEIAYMKQMVVGLAVLAVLMAVPSLYAQLEEESGEKSAASCIFPAGKMQDVSHLAFNPRAKLEMSQVLRFPRTQIARSFTSCVQPAR